MTGRGRLKPTLFHCFNEYSNLLEKIVKFKYKSTEWSDFP